MSSHGEGNRLLVGFVTILLAASSALPVVLQGQSFSVYPDGGSLAKAQNTAGHSESFGVVNSQSGVTYFIELLCTAPVQSCSSPIGSSFVGPRTSVSINFSVGSPGVGRLRVRIYKGGGVPSDSGWYNVTVNETTPPSTSLMLPTSVVDVQYPTIKVGWCDNASLNAASRWIKVNSTNLTSSFDYNTSDGPGCTARAASTTTSVPLNLGINQVEARICDNASNCTTDSHSITRRDPNPPTISLLSPATVFSETPQIQLQWCDNESLGAGSRWIKINGVDRTAAFDYVTGGAGCNVRATSTSSIVSLQVGANTVEANICDAWSNCTPQQFTITRINPAGVALVNHNGDNLDRSLCLTIAAGDDAAVQCGDLLAHHAMPAVWTMNAPRMLTLMYNSAAAEPRPRVAAEVTLAAGEQPQSVYAQLTVGGAVRASATYSSWAASVTRQISLAFDASELASGLYPFDLMVRSIYPGGVTDVTVSDTLIVVNRESSDFGAGWHLAGVEGLVLGQPEGRILWVGGDGSARVYRADGVGEWIAAKGDFRDRIYQVTGGNYERRGQHGLVVTFDGAGRHIQTKNRLNHVTSFNWTSGRLASIMLPPANSTYQLQYDGQAKLDSITDPAGRVLNVTISDGSLTQVVDPDGYSVSYGYDGEQRLTSRTNRRFAATAYDYDNGLRVTAFRVPLSVSDSATTTFTHWDELGLAIGQTVGTFTSSDPAVVRTRMDGPRVPSDVADVTTFWLDRFGAPKRVVNALGHETIIRRDDARWTALPTEIVGPDTFIVRATYDDRANLVTRTEVGPFGDSQNAVTQYFWNAQWDFPDSVITPTGLITIFGYDATNGNRRWQQTGRDAARRVEFSYSNPHSLLSSATLPETPSDSVEYDGRGNLAATRTPLGYWTSYYKDLIGRNTLVVKPINSTDTSRGGPEDDTSRTRHWTTYTVMNRDSTVVAIAPNASEYVAVVKQYDSEGNLQALHRASFPNTAGIGTVTTSWRYDLANRRVAEVPPDAVNEDSTAYDPAGNIIAAVSRRTDPTSGARLVVQMSYDALNRMTSRQLPQVSYQSRPTGFDITSPWSVTAYPAYAIPAETHTFTYDAAGRLLTADNADAKVWRKYYRGGLLELDSLRIQTVGRDDWEWHKYGLRHTYDLDGRRQTLAIPRQLGIGNDTTISFTYVWATGLLGSVGDLQNNTFLFNYNVRGELDTLWYPGAYNEALRYDFDGRLRADTIRNTGNALFPRIPSALARATTFSYDARNKLLWSGDGVRFKDTVAVTYTGLGNAIAVVWAQRGCDSCDLNPDLRYVTQETHAQDAMANRTLTGLVSQMWDLADGGFSYTGYCCDTLRYQAGTGRLLSVSPAASTPRRSLIYDQAGNEIFSAALDPGKPSSERAAFFAADGTLRMVDSRFAANDHAQATQTQRYAVEDYRYDALGRRVWLRARKWCDDYGLTQFAATECRTGIIRRTIWDGDQEVAEIQMPWSLQGIGLGTYIVTEYPSLWENDTLPVDLPLLNISIAPGSSAPGGDPNPYFGHVVYTGFRGIDQPLGVTRRNYSWKLDWHNPSTPYGATQVKAPFTIVPFWNARGEAQQGVMNGGVLSLCNPANERKQCVGIQWPWDVSAADRQRNLSRGSWHGTMLESKRDKSGLGYMRNRYYDPQTGRFTQEDPIGLAGGMNLYGFAAGDPVNYSDPFGLCPPKDDNVNDCPEESSRGFWDRLWNGPRYVEINGQRHPIAAGVVPDVVPGAGAARTAFRSFGAFKRAMGAADEGMQWHHIVEQAGNAQRFGAEAVHGVENLLQVPTAIHRQISAYYSSKQAFTGGQTVRMWLRDQSFSDQLKFGLDVLRNFGIR